MGVVCRAHGLRGEMVIESYCDPSEEIASYAPLAFGEAGPRVSFEITGKSRERLIARLGGIGNRGQAERARGVRLFANRSAFPDTEPDEFYHCDLIGLSAIDERGMPMGRVTDVVDYGAGTLLRIKPAKGQSVFIPLTKDHVGRIDLASGVLAVEDPDIRS